MKKLIAVLLMAVLLCGCGVSAPEKHEITFFAMDTVMNITIYGGSDSMLNGCAELVNGLERKLSVTDSGSEIHAVNEAGQGSVSEETASLLQSALALCQRTEGRLDVTVYPVLKSWGFTGDTYRIPDEAELDALLRNVDYRRVQLSGDNVMLPEGVMLDLGSVGKGYTSDAICNALRQAGIQSACINLGGNVQTVGGKPDGSAWRVGIADPDSGDSVGAVEIKDKAAITSGMYQRYFVGEDGTVYGHIIDPKTGHPADSDLKSVTVVGASGTVCDGFSTGLFVAGLEDALALWRASDDFEAVFILTDGTVVITEGLQDSFRLLQKDRQLQVAKR